MKCRFSFFVVPLTALFLASCGSTPSLTREQAWRPAQERRQVVRNNHRNNNTRPDQTFMDNNTYVGAPYHFHDVNGQQLEAAMSVGIDPIENRREARRRTDELTEVHTCYYYVIDRLTHSIPYLTNNASELLDDIGRGFQSELERRGYRRHRIIVTSLLRTKADVERLIRVNGNAVRNSAHEYGTTFDISYTRFNRTSLDGRPINNDDMAQILGEVLSRLRSQGRLWAIYERNQHCFHITSRR